MQSFSDCLQEIHYLNLSYLLLIQRISTFNEPNIDADINEELVKVLQSLPLSKLVSLAETSQLLITLKPGIIKQQLDDGKVTHTQ
ncbi:MULTISPECIES: flagellar transcriptional regulator FlhD [Lelliottia]|jgi:hypothetical protein|uniref:Flagellar transcriptional regulator FlhD n=1 Tax=Pseudomonas tritici TaxID=2745518 RepID=A0A8H9YTW4_9PSED|nr:flagellar transcriptional regulator FlhD [Lelliottia amnigena]